MTLYSWSFYHYTQFSLFWGLTQASTLARQVFPCNNSGHWHRSWDPVSFFYDIDRRGSRKNSLMSKEWEQKFLWGTESEGNPTVSALLWPVLMPHSNVTWSLREEMNIFCMWTPKPWALCHSRTHLGGNQRVFMDCVLTNHLACNCSLNIFILKHKGLARYIQTTLSTTPHKFHLI